MPVPSILGAQVKIPETSRGVRRTQGFVLQAGQESYERAFPTRAPHTASSGFVLCAKSLTLPLECPQVSQRCCGTGIQVLLLWKFEAKPQQSQRIFTWPVCSSLRQAPPPNSTCDSELAKCLVPRRLSSFSALLCCSQPLWITGRLQKATKCGLSVAFRGRALLSKQKEGPPSS